MEKDKNVKIDKSVHEKLKIHCAKLGVNMTEWATDIVLKGIQEEEKRSSVPDKTESIKDWARE
jgi:stress response protein YsnF